MEVEGLTTCDIFLRSTLQVLVTYWFIGVEGKGKKELRVIHGFNLGRLGTCWSLPPGTSEDGWGTGPWTPSLDCQLREGRCHICPLTAVFPMTGTLKEWTIGHPSQRVLLFWWQFLDSCLLYLILMRLNMMSNIPKFWRSWPICSSNKSLSNAYNTLGTTPGSGENIKANRRDKDLCLHGVFILVRGDRQSK